MGRLQEKKKRQQITQVRGIPNVNMTPFQPPQPTAGERVTAAFGAARRFLLPTRREILEDAQNEAKQSFPPERIVREVTQRDIGSVSTADYGSVEKDKVTGRVTRKKAEEDIDKFLDTPRFDPMMTGTLRRAGTKILEELGNKVVKSLAKETSEEAIEKILITKAPELAADRSVLQRLASEKSTTGIRNIIQEAGDMTEGKKVLGRVQQKKAAEVVDKQLPETLIEEARKYKSADEFVKAQSDPLFEFKTGNGIQDEYIARGTVEDAISDIGGPENIHRGFININKLETTENISTASQRYKSVLQQVKNGERTPIIVNEFGEVMDGHHRLKAYKELGINEVPVISPKNFDVNTKNQSQLTDIYNQATKAVKNIADDTKPRVNTKLEEMAKKSRNYDDFVRRAGVTDESLEATVRQKGYKTAQEFYDEVTEPLTAKSAKEIIDERAPMRLGKAANPVDQLITDGKVRIVSRNGRDVYQYITKDGWKNASTDYMAAERAIKNAKPKPGAELTPELEQRQLMLEFQQEALDNSPFNNPQNRFFVDSEGRVRELGDLKSGPLVQKFEDIIAESGVKDATRYREGLEDFFKRKAQLKLDRKQLAEEIRTFKTSAQNAAKEAAAEERATAYLTKVKKPELQSLEESAERALSDEIIRTDSPAKKLDEMLPTQTPVTKKVNIVDLFRTPEAVFKKIGLEKEMKFLRQQNDKYLKELPVNLQKVTDWYNLLPKATRADASKRIFRALDGQMVLDMTPTEKKIKNEMEAWLADWANRLKIPHHARLKNYITHIFEDQLIEKEFDEDLAKIIADKIPGEVYNPFLQKRLGQMGYKEDVFVVLDAYVKRGTRKVHMDPALDVIERKADSFEKSQWQYVKNQIDRINMRPTEVDEWIDNFIKSTPIKYRMGQRPVAAASRFIRQVSYRAFLGLNISSAIKNLSQGANTYAVLGEKYTALGYLNLFKKGAIKELEEVGVLQDNFVQDRTISATKKTWEKIDKALWVFFDAAEKINRGAAYHGAKTKALNEGMSNSEAIDYAKEIVRKTQFAFGSIDTPAVISSDIMKTVAQLQSYTIKQSEFLLGMVKDKNFVGLARYSLAGVLFVYTIGQMFDMDLEELIPTSRLTEQVFLKKALIGVPPGLQLPVEVAGAALDMDDEYGNKRDAEKKLRDIGDAVWGVIPAGSQLKKTLKGIKAISEGGSFDQSDRLQFEVPTEGVGKWKTILFGKYSGPEADAYFDRVENNKKDKRKMQPIYDEVQALAADGKEKEAQQILDSLSDMDYEAYKQLHSDTVAKKNAHGRKNILPTYQKVRSLVEKGKTEEAQAIVDGLSDDEYKFYTQVHKQLERDAKAEKGEKPEFSDNESVTEGSFINTITTYAQAIGTDPVTAFDRIFTGQKIRRVDNGVIIIYRMPLEESQAIKTKRGAKDDEILDHFVPLQLGGSNKETNLILVPRDLWELYTPVENHIGELLREKKIKGDEAEQLITDFKMGKITAESIMAR